MRTKHYDRVHQFMALAKQECPTAPTIPPEDVRRLRAKLILEEALETVEALGFLGYARFTETHEGITEHEVFLTPHSKGPNLEEIIDGCCDVAVVTTGTLIACGIPDDLPQRMVDQNNLAKFGPGHTYRADGKLIKPPGHTKPPWGKLLDNLRKWARKEAVGESDMAEGLQAVIEEASTEARIGSLQIAPDEEEGDVLSIRFRFKDNTAQVNMMFKDEQGQKMEQVLSLRDAVAHIGGDPDDITSPNALWRVLRESNRRSFTVKGLISK